MCRSQDTESKVQHCNFCNRTLPKTFFIKNITRCRTCELLRRKQQKKDVFHTLTNKDRRDKARERQRAKKKAQDNPALISFTIENILEYFKEGPKLE